MVKFTEEFSELIKDRVRDILVYRPHYEENWLVSDVINELKEIGFRGLTSRNFHVSFDGKEYRVNNFAEVLKILGFAISWHRHGSGGCYRVRLND